MGILEEMMAELLAIKAETAAIKAERLYISKVMELIQKVMAARAAGLPLEALEKAEMFLSEEAYRMELAEEEVGNEKLYAGDMLLDNVSLYPQLRKEV